jgi:hypothetical protein
MNKKALTPEELALKVKKAKKDGAAMSPRFKKRAVSKK